MRDRGHLSRSHIWLLLGISVAILGFYLITIAPGLLWGDNAYFQRSASTGAIRPDGGGHWLWLQIAKLFVQLPFSEPAFRVNLLSTFAAAGTVMLVAATSLNLKLGSFASLVTALCLAVSHTFWTNAVMAEVYSVFTLMMALQLLLWSAWKPHRSWPIIAAALLFGISLLAHQMVLPLLPSAAYLLWRRRGWLGLRQWLLLAAAFGIGVSVFLLVTSNQIDSGTLLTDIRRYLTYAGLDYGPSLFDFRLSKLPVDAATWFGLLGLQFFGLAFLLGVWGIFQLLFRSQPNENRSIWAALLILYVTSVIFAFSYRVNDQYVFYLPSYLAFSFFIGLGWRYLMSNRALIIQAAALAALVSQPIITYYALPKALDAADISIPGARSLPGREFSTFFLWPSKRGNLGAADYSQKVLEDLPQDAYFIADHTSYEPVRYLQEVQGIRPDVTLMQTPAGRDLTFFLKRIPPDSRVFLAGSDPEYYNLKKVKGAELKPFGLVFELSGVQTGN